MTTPRTVDGVTLKASQQLVWRALERLEGDVHYCALPPPEHAGRLLGAQQQQQRQQQRLLAFLEQPEWDSGAVPPALDPANYVPERRRRRKRAQLHSMALCVALVASDLLIDDADGAAEQQRHLVLVDWCGGGGHLGLLLAALLEPFGVKVVVQDVKQRALDACRRRAREAGLRNVRVLHGDIRALHTAGGRASAAEVLGLGELGVGRGARVVGVGVALHACGDLSDYALAHNAALGLRSVVCPCCVGNVANTGRGPRSAWLRAALSLGEFQALARAADFSENFGDSAEQAWRLAAKALLETDRMRGLRELRPCRRRRLDGDDEHPSETALVKMLDRSASAKHDIILAYPPLPHNAAHRYLGAVADAGVLPASMRARTSAAMTDDFASQAVEALRARMLDWQQRDCAEAAQRRILLLREYRGPRQRKMVHAVADALGLYHFSVGEGRRRVAAVSRRFASLHPVCVRDHVSVVGREVEQTAARFVHLVPSAARARRTQVREARHHITLLTREEMCAVCSDDSGAPEPPPPQRLVDAIEHCLLASQPPPPPSSPSSSSSSTPLPPASASYTALGVGQARQGDNCTYFVVLRWPAADALRAALHLPPHDFHITLGFDDCDIHDVDKGASTLVAPA